MRLETFSDGVFAITLLALQVHPPNLALFLGWLLLVVGGRWAVRVWSARHRRRMADR
jgi:hypothetical protein